MRAQAGAVRVRGAWRVLFSALRAYGALTAAAGVLVLVMALTLGLAVVAGFSTLGHLQGAAASAEALGLWGAPR